MSRSYPIADARRNFAGVIAAATRGDTVELTRHGKTVAVVVSAARYAALSGEAPAFVDAVRNVRDRFAVGGLGIDDGVFASLRDRSRGRDVEL